MHERARWGIKKRSGVADDGSCCRDASCVITEHLGGRFLGGRGRPRSLANSILQPHVPGKGYRPIYSCLISSSLSIRSSDQDRLFDETQMKVS